jgi:hypothetical protein
MRMKRQLLLAILLLLFALPFLAQAQTATPTFAPTPSHTVTPTLMLTPAPGASSTSAIPLPNPFLTPSYQFEGEAGQFINILLQTDVYETDVRLIDPSGVEIIAGAFSIVGMGLEIPALRLPDSGLYTMVVERHSGLSSYTLHLRTADVQPIEYGQLIEGELTPTQPARLYQFSGSLGDWIDVSVTAAEFDVEFLLLNAANVHLSGDANSGGGLDAFMGPYQLPETGDYLLRVRSSDVLPTGTFQLHLGRAEFIPFEYGDSVEVTLSQEDPVAYYSFGAEVGDVVIIQVDSGGGLDTALNLIDPQSSLIFTSDDTEYGFDPEIRTFPLFNAGQYVIQVRPSRIAAAEEQVTLSLSVQSSP